MGKRENRVDLQSVIEGLMRQLEGKDHMIDHLLERIDELERTIKEQGRSIEKMADVIATYERKLFGTSSEKTHAETRNEDNSDGDEATQDEERQEQDGDSTDDNNDDDQQGTTGSSPDVPATPRKKKSYSHPHKRDYSDIEADKVIELRPNAEEIKGARFIKVNKSFRFYFIPGKLCKVRYDRYVYSKDGHLVIPPLPYVPEDIEKRHATPELIATLLCNKYLYHIPIERQLNMLNAGNIQIAITTLHDWTTAGLNSLDGVYEAIRSKVLSDNRLHIDETTMPVVDLLKHGTRKGYDWGFISPTHKLMFFSRSKGSRGADVLDEQMKDYSGKYIQTDGYSAYINVGERLEKEIIHIPCLAHVRRKFRDSLKYHKKKAEEALKIINEIFKNEAQYREQNLPPNVIEARREIELRPLLDRFKEWLQRQIETPGFFSDSNIGKAITYAWERIDQFYQVIKNGLLDVSNNLAERTMRSHAMGRKNFLFCQNEDSASRTCKIYSIIESCKLSNVDPYRYLCAVLSRQPAPGETWDDLIPGEIAL